MWPDMETDPRDRTVNVRNRTKRIVADARTEDHVSVAVTLPDLCVRHPVDQVCTQVQYGGQSYKENGTADSGSHDLRALFGLTGIWLTCPNYGARFISAT
jgi:hypothetical protein